jgi:hypothetical protein
MEPMEFMLRRRVRLSMGDEAQLAQAQPQRGRPAVLVEPVPPGGRFAKKGERPPSRFAPGENDNVIARYDAYAQAYWSGKVKRNGR